MHHLFLERSTSEDVMELRLDVCLFAVTANLGCLLLMWATQHSSFVLPTRQSLIDGTRQKFLYLQDFWTMTLGDIVGVTMIAITFAHLVVEGRVQPWHWVMAALIGITAATIFFIACTQKNHKPDWGFPTPGTISLGGVIHLFYYGGVIGIIAICIWLFFADGLYDKPAMWIGWASAIPYGLSFYLDLSSGNFDPIKWEEQPENPAVSQSWRNIKSMRQ